jgi:hypothetical protein
MLLAQADDPEIRWRLRAAAASYQWACMVATWDRRGWPWVDALPDQPWQGLPLPHEEEDQGNADWPEYKRATRVWARWQLEAGRSVTDLHMVLIEAEQRCDYWRRHRRYPP